MTHGNLALAFDRPAPQPEQQNEARPALQLVDGEAIEHWLYEVGCLLSKGSNRQVVAYHKPGKEKLELTTLYAVAKTGIPCLGIKGLTQINKMVDYSTKVDALKTLFAVIQTLRFDGLQVRYVEEITPAIVAAKLAQDAQYRRLGMWRTPHPHWKLNVDLKNLLF